MTKIKYIHCFGTSYTAGGGFEFESRHPNVRRDLIQVYGRCDEQLTQSNFSWPGQLQNLIGDFPFVLNHGKQGYGNDRTFRLVYELINKPDFKKEENLLILEFAGLGRQDFFFKEVGDFVICNYQMINDENEYYPFFKYVGAAKSYGYDTDEITKKIDEYESFFNTYIDKFIDFDVEQTKLVQQTDFFLSYLEKMGISFLFSMPPILNYRYDISKEIEFGDGKKFKKTNNFVQFTDDNNLRIIDETKEKYSDGHCGLKANKIISHCIYNKLVNDNYITNNTIPIDWDFYYKKDYLKKTI